MKENKFVEFLKKYAGILIGLAIGILIYFCNFLHRFFMFALILLVCAVIGNYVQKNKDKVKAFLKNAIDKM